MFVLGGWCILVASGFGWWCAGDWFELIDLFGWMNGWVGVACGYLRVGWFLCLGLAVLDWCSAFGCCLF